MRATVRPFEPSSAAKASPAGPQPTTHTSAVVAKGSNGCSTDAMDGCSASSLLACIDGMGASWYVENTIYSRGSLMITGDSKGHMRYRKSAQPVSQLSTLVRYG